MLQDMVHPQDQQLSIEEITSPLGAQILEFCESELFPETLQNSEVASTSNCCYEDINNMKPPPLSASTPPATATRNTSLPIFDEDQIENDISAISIDFTSSPYIMNNNNNNNQLLLGDIAPPYVGPERWSTVTPPPGVVPILATSYEEECQLPSYMSLRTSQSTIHDPMMPSFLPPFGAETSGIFAGSGLMHLGNDISHQELDFQGDNAALFLTDTALPRVFNCSTELQGLSSESQQLIHGGANTTTSTNLASEISSLEDPTFKVGKLSVEERKRKIHRYLQKRNERNFSKKIKYACRKTLADSRPRVRGRFAKNDELGDINGRSMSSNHEDETDEDVGIFANSIPHDHHRKVVVKEEDDMDSSDILAHISGVNSFKCNYPIQSWI